MQFPFCKQPAPDPSAQLSSPDGLHRSSAHSMVTRIDSPDQKIPVNFSMPDLDVIREELYRRIDAAAARGGLDAGNAAYADQWIDDLLAGWLQEARKESQEHSHVAAQIVGANLQNLTISYDELGRLEREVRVVESQEQAFLTELLTEQGPLDEVSKKELQTTLHTLPAPSQLSGLDLQPVTRKMSIAAIETADLLGRKELDRGEPENVHPLRRSVESDPIEQVVPDNEDDSAAPSSRRTTS
ncbi:MAG: hypothetical protein ACOH1U_07825 [Rhodoglobus sp.]